MTRWLLTLTLLLLPLGRLDAQDLAGRWSVEGEDAQGPYTGAVELFANEGGYRLVRSVRGQEIRGGLSTVTTQPRVEVGEDGVKAYKSRLLVGRKKAVIPRGTILKVLKQRMRAFEVEHEGKTLWVAQDKVTEIPGRVEYHASLERSVGATGALEVALGSSSAAKTLTGTFLGLEAGLLEGSWDDSGKPHCRWAGCRFVGPERTTCS